MGGRSSAREDGARLPMSFCFFLLQNITRLVGVSPHKGDTRMKMSHQTNNGPMRCRNIVISGADDDGDVYFGRPNVCSRWRFFVRQGGAASQRSASRRNHAGTSGRMSVFYRKVFSSAPMRAFNSKTCCPDWKPILQSGGAGFAAIWLQPGLLTTFAPSTAATFSILRCFASIQRTDLVAADRTVMHR